MTRFTRRTLMTGMAGSAAAIAGAPFANAIPRTSSNERHFPAQTAWTAPPPLKPAREGLVTLSDTALWYQDTGGSGEVVVLLHAWTGSYATWGYQQGAFAKAGYRVISYSMRGHYRSGKIDPQAPGTATGDLRALLDHLKIGRAHLVGTAGGALPALDYGLSSPERVISLTLASSHMGISDPAFLEIGSKMFPKGVYSVSHAFSEIGPSYRAGYPAGVAAWEALDEMAWQGGALRQTVDRPITFARIAKMTVPTLFITGDADLMMPPSRMREVAARTPGCELAIVAEAGHSLHWEQPIAFNRVVLDFLKRKRERAGGGKRRG